MLTGPQGMESHNFIFKAIFAARGWQEFASLQKLEV
jgi:hypothetical protein